MKTQLKKECPKCGFLLEIANKTSWEFGNPFVTCPKCGNISVDETKKEISMLTNWDYFTYFISTSIGILGISFFLAIICYGVFNQLLKLEENISFIISTCFFVIFIIIFSNLIIKNFKKEKQASLERLKNKDYINKLKTSALIEDYNFNSNIPISKYDTPDKKENFSFIIIIVGILLIILTITFIYKINK